MFNILRDGKTISNGPQILEKSATTLVPSSTTLELNDCVVLVDPCVSEGCHKYTFELINMGTFPVSIDFFCLTANQ